MKCGGRFFADISSIYGTLVKMRVTGGWKMKLDHVVYFTKKSPQEIVEEQQIEGNYAVIGGRHEKWGTHNALMYVKNAYVEWLSIEQPEIAEQVDHPLTRLLLHDLEEKEGWGTLCFSVPDIERFDEDIQNKGFSTSGVLNAERRTTSGELRKWKMLFVDQPVSNELPYPFFIEWEEADHVRFDNLRADGTLSRDNEALEIKECIFGVEDPLRDTGEWAILLSQKVGDNNDISLQNVKLRFIEQDDGKDRLKDVIIRKGQ